MPRDTVTFVSNQLDVVLKLQQKKKTVSYGTGEEQHLDIMKAYDSLTKQLRSLDGLPLAIHSIQGTSAAFRFAQVSSDMGEGECTTSSCTLHTGEVSHLQVCSGKQ